VYYLGKKFFEHLTKKEFFLVICGFVDQGVIRNMEFLYFRKSVKFYVKDACRQVQYQNISLLP